MHTFERGQEVRRGMLDIFADPGDWDNLRYTLYYLGGSEHVVIGDPLREPVNPQAGEYYAALVIPPSAPTGLYRIRWTFDKEGTARALYEEFRVV